MQPAPSGQPLERWSEKDWENLRSGIGIAGIIVMVSCVALGIIAMFVLSFTEHIHDLGLGRWPDHEIKTLQTVTGIIAVPLGLTIVAGVCGGCIHIVTYPFIELSNYLQVRKFLKPWLTSVSSERQSEYKKFFEKLLKERDHFLVTTSYYEDNWVNPQFLFNHIMRTIDDTHQSEYLEAAQSLMSWLTDQPTTALRDIGAVVSYVTKERVIPLGWFGYFINKPEFLENDIFANNTLYQLVYSHERTHNSNISPAIDLLIERTTVSFEQFPLNWVIFKPFFTNKTWKIVGNGPVTAETWHAVFQSWSEQQESCPWGPGLPTQEAAEVTGQIVTHCIGSGATRWSPNEMQALLGGFQLHRGIMQEHYLLTHLESALTNAFNWAEEVQKCTSTVLSKFTPNSGGLWESTGAIGAIIFRLSGFSRKKP